MNIWRDKVIGMFLGGAIGDALGMPLEMYSKEKKEKCFGRIEFYIRPDGHKWFNGRGAGEWTDDWFFTGLTAKSVIARGRVDIYDIAKRHAAAYKRGDLKKYGSGRATRKSLRRMAKGVHWSKSGMKGAAGNGVVMKLSPLVACQARITAGGRALTVYLLEDDIKKILDFTKMTHNSRLASIASIYHAYAIKWCLENERLEEQGDFTSFSFGTEVVSYLWSRRLFGKNKLADELSDKMVYLFTRAKNKLPRKMSDGRIIKTYGKGSAYVMDTLPFSYAFFLRKPHSIEALYDVVNAGGDTDTNGSIVGSLLGALNGTKIFPQHLIDGLWRKDEIFKIANDFCDKFRIED